MATAMDPCPDEETILAFVEDRLRPARRPAIEAHAASCEACSALLAAVASAWFSEGKLGSPASAKAPELTPGERVGPYTISARAGSGSMGDVYRAKDERLGRDVALKTLPPRFASDPDRLARFRQEARAAGALSHPHLLTIFDVGSHAGAPYLVAEWLAGTTLQDRIAGGPLPAAQARRVALEIARGLAAAHDKGIVHRDIKPANLFLCEDGTTKILDFGLAKLAEGLAEGAATQAGVLVGTAGYMAPEQVRGLPADHRADIFALGAVLHEMLTGRPAFGGGTAVERMSAALRDEPKAVAGELGPVIARCLAKDPAARFQSARDLAFCLEAPASQSSDDSLAAATRGATVAPPPRSLRAAAAVAGTIALAVVASAIGYAAGQRGSDPVKAPPASSAAPAASASAASASATAALDPGLAASRPEYRPLTFRRGQLTAARFSADGHTVVYSAAWEGAPSELFTARVDGPGSRSLEVKGDLLAVSERGELALLLEPHLYEDHTLGTLARLPLGGGAPRPLASDVQDASFRPGGSELTVVRKSGGRFLLESPLGKLRYETEGWISHLRVSPDGKRSAFILHPNPKDDRGNVMVLEEEGAPRELSADWASAQGLCFSPSGERIWFTAAKDDANSALWEVDLAGKLRLVDRVAGRLVVHDCAANGSALVDHQALRLGLVSGRKDAPTSAAGAAGERELTWSDTSFLTDMTPDGSKLVFAEMGASEGPSYGAYLRATDGSPPLRLGDGLPLAISPDGKRVLAMRYEGDSVALSLLAAGTGEAQKISLSPIAVVLNARFFPDGKRLLVRGNEEGHTARLWVSELGGGAPKPLTAEGDAPIAAVAPDGAKIAAIDPSGALRILSAEGKEPGAVPGRFPGQTVIAWDRSSAAVYVRTADLPARIAKVEVASGVAKPHLALPGRAGWAGLTAVLTMSLSADGATYAYSYNEILSQLYLVQGLR